MQAFTKVGLEALLTPDNCALVLIDHQPFQLANVNSHEPTMVINNVTALAKTAKAFDVPTILTTVNEQRGGRIFKTVQDVFPNQKTIDRTFINAWEDGRVVEAVKKTGRRKVVFAALWSEMCLAMPVIHAMGDGYDVLRGYGCVGRRVGGSTRYGYPPPGRRGRSADHLAGDGRRTTAGLGSYRQVERGGADPARSRRRIWISIRLGNATAERYGAERSVEACAPSEPRSRARVKPTTDASRPRLPSRDSGAFRTCRSWTNMTTFQDFDDERGGPKQCHPQKSM
jgi:hypothetical protein